MNSVLGKLVTNAAIPDRDVPALFTERYRPQLHYSAPQHWLNDPNGLVWNDGVFHLFYQHNPNGNDWGNMHWGHAESRDLVHWRHRPIALHADPWGVGFAFSGCVVADPGNTSGLAAAGATPLVALYTGAGVDGLQTQCLAYSVDGGSSWKQHENNPVIANPGIDDFRDPKVIWNGERQEWVMVLAVGDRLELYVSADLLNWSRVSEFRCAPVEDGEVLECPDLFPMQSASGDQHWILIVSATSSRAHKDRSTRYYIGTFDGCTFAPYDQNIRWLDHGPDNYASVTWDNVPVADGRRIAIGWMSNWRYAREAPTYPWRGHMTFPRELALVAAGDGYHLASQPVADIQRLYQRSQRVHPDRIDSAGMTALFSALPADLLDLALTFSWHAQMPLPFGLEFVNGTGDLARIVINPERGTVSVDRTGVGRSAFSRRSAGVFEAPVQISDQQLDVRVVKDRASVEVFVAGGKIVVSANLFYERPFDSVRLIGNGAVTLHGQVAVLNSIWAETERPDDDV